MQYAGRIAAIQIPDLCNTLSWQAAVFKKLLAGTDTEIEGKLETWRRQVMAAAASIVFCSSCEIGRQLHVDLPEQPFSAAQQKRTRMDGGRELDGTSRTLLPIVPPLDEPHLALEKQSAALNHRQPRAAYDVPLSGSRHSSSPTYRLLQSFGLLRHAAPACQLSKCHSLPLRSSEDGVVLVFSCLTAIWLRQSKWKQKLLYGQSTLRPMLSSCMC